MAQDRKVCWWDFESGLLRQEVTICHIMSHHVTSDHFKVTFFIIFYLIWLTYVITLHESSTGEGCSSQEGTPSCHCQVFVGGVPQDLNQDDLYVLWQILCAQIVADGDIDGEDLLLLCVFWCELKNKVRIRNSLCQSGFFQWTSRTKNVRPSRCVVFKFGSGLHHCIGIIGSMMLTLQWFWRHSECPKMKSCLQHAFRFHRLRRRYSTTYIIYIYG